MTGPILMPPSLENKGLGARDWTTDPRATLLLALCAENAPEQHTASGLGLGGTEYRQHYSHRDPRVRQLHQIRGAAVGTDPAAYFNETTVDQAISEAVQGFGYTCDPESGLIMERAA